MTSTKYFLIGVLLTILSNLTSAQDVPDWSRSTVEIAPQHLSLKKPPVYETHSPCEVVFINYTNTPLQISWLDHDGRLRKLYYIDRKDTVQFKSKTNHHLIVTYQGFTAAAMFVPYGDINICKIHDKFFHSTQRIKPKQYGRKDPPLESSCWYRYKVKPESYGKGKGPTIMIDEHHLNTHTVDGLYKPMAKILEKDGYNVIPYQTYISQKGLSQGEILIMANPYGQQVNGWMVDSSQALIAQEVKALESWVKNGGKLLLLIDGSPYPSRVQNIAKAFGFEFMEGTVKDTTNLIYGDLHDKVNNTLADNVITQGRNDKERVDQVATFGGMAMKIPEKAENILKFGDNWVVVKPTENGTQRTSTKGLSQGAIMKYGEGKIAVIGDPDAITAMKSDHGKVGMNWKYAQDNPKFFLNLIHWLDGFVE